MDYDEYFNNQIGCGYSTGIGRVYIGSYQRGHGGVGRFLAGLFRRVLPLLKSGAKTLGKEAVRTGINVVNDVTTQNKPISEAFQNRIRESARNLKRKAEEKLDKMMQGSGYKYPHLIGALQLPGSSDKANKRPKKNKINKNKIKKKQIKKKKQVVKKKLKAFNKKCKKFRTVRDIFG